MRTILYSSPFVPAEWIAAHGLRPSRVITKSPRGAPGAGICPFSLSFREALHDDCGAAGAIFTTTCDQMRRAAELAARETRLPLFLMNVPATWQSPAAQRMYISEIQRLGRFLVRLGGAAPGPDELAAAMERFDDSRRELLSLKGRVTAREFALHLMAIQYAGEPVRESCLRKSGRAPASRRTVPLALIGGPLLGGDLAWFDIVERFGGEIVLDGTETGERMLPLSIERRWLRDDPLSELGRIYFAGLPDAFRRPNSELYRWLRRELDARGARGIIYRRYPWCDIWHAELARLREWARLPVLDLDVFESFAGTSPHFAEKFRSDGLRAKPAVRDDGVEPLVSGKLQSFLEALQ
jgi:benzoyl-CoA reductase/2-hydroxyglutaryl-CoA dehydratase subunit BcrC/BadD/HgdB